MSFTNWYVVHVSLYISELSLCFSFFSQLMCKVFFFQSCVVIFLTPPKIVPILKSDSDALELLENLIFDSESIQISHQQNFYPDLESLYLILIQKLRRYDKIYYLDGIRQIPIYNYNSCLTLALDLCHRYWEEGLDNHTLRNSLFFDRFDTFFPEASGVTYKPFIEKLITYIEEHLSGFASPKLNHCSLAAILKIFIP